MLCSLKLVLNFLVLLVLGSFIVYMLCHKCRVLEHQLRIFIKTFLFSDCVLFCFFFVFGIFFFLAFAVFV